MYAVVGCSECEALWLVEGRPATTGCPRCGTRHRFDRLRRLAEAEDEDVARQARAAILAERSGDGDEFAEAGSFAELADAAGDAAVPDREYLEAAGLDVEAIEAAGDEATRGAGRSHGSRTAVVRAALRELDSPTESSVLDYAAGYDVPPEAARGLLDRLVETGEASEDRGRYRLL